MFQINIVRYPVPKNQLYISFLKSFMSPVKSLLIALFTFKPEIRIVSLMFDVRKVKRVREKRVLRRMRGRVKCENCLLEYAKLIIM